MDNLMRRLDEYCKNNDLQNPGINMWIFSHNDMLNFAQYYAEKEYKKDILNKKIKKIRNKLNKK